MPKKKLPYSAVYQRKAWVYNKSVDHMHQPTNIGMFGGSFNPPHNGHVEIAARLGAEFALSRVLFVVAADPPHKEVAGGVDANTRLALTKAALAGRAGLEASDIELRRRGKSYTIDTLRALREAHPEAKLFLLLGEDMLESFPLWREPEEIAKLACILTASRPGAEADIQRTAEKLIARYGADIRCSTFAGPDISSTAVRSHVLEGKPISALVPPGVEKLVYERALYQPENVRFMQEKLRASLAPARFAHSLGTMREAVELAARFGFDGQKARVAGLLHDCAKLSGETLLMLAARYGVEPDALEREHPGLLHDRIGARYAREEYGVLDEEVLAAISCHTRCEAGMSAFSRMIYLADKIEPTRDYPGVGEIREVARADMNRAALLCMQRVLGHLERQKMRVQPNIYAAINELKNIINTNKSTN